nr:MAG TPA: hypothetical protein [Caudoviricetes sp.]
MSDPVDDRLNVIERGLRAEVEEYREAIAAVDLLLVVSARMCGRDSLDSTVACLRRLRGELGACKLQALTSLGRLAHSRVYATRMGCSD